MEKIKQSGAVFQSNTDSQPSQFSFTDLSTHLFAAFASNDCPLPLFLDQNSSDHDPYFLSDQPFRSTGDQPVHVPPGFEDNSDALAAAEIEKKMADFQFESFITGEDDNDEQ